MPQCHIISQNKTAWLRGTGTRPLLSGNDTLRIKAGKSYIRRLSCPKVPEASFMKDTSPEVLKTEVARQGTEGNISLTTRWNFQCSEVDLEVAPGSTSGDHVCWIAKREILEGVKITRD